MAKCELCTNEVMPDERFCPPCYALIPAHFTCSQCGERCNKDDDDFGGYEPGQNTDKPICLECLETEKTDDLRTIYDEEEHHEDFFEDEYFDEY